jgi:hypothetical protein
LVGDQVGALSPWDQCSSSPTTMPRASSSTGRCAW